MVQLIRIVSDTETVTDVTNFFNESISISPNSKIALESLKIELSDIITVTTDNNTFDTQISTNNTPNYEVVLNTGIYTQSSFIDELTRAMASSMLYTFRPRIGTEEKNYTEWKPIIFNDKLVIQYATATPDTGRNNNFKGDLITGKIVQIGGATVEGYYLDDTYYRNDNAVENAYISAESVGVNGALEWRMTVGTNAVPGIGVQAVYNDLFIGLRDINAPLIPIQTINDLRYGIGIFQGDTPSDFIVVAYIDGAEYGRDTFLNFPDGTGDRSDVSLKITLQQGNVAFWHSMENVNGNGVWYSIPSNGNLQSAYNYDTTFLGYILMGERYNTVYNVCFTPSPYQNANSSGLSLVKLNSEIQDIESHIKYDELEQPASGPTTHTVIFSNEVKKLLGFLLNQYTVTSIANQFLAESAIDMGFYSDEIIVELPTEFVNAYEGSQHRRRNIIRYIPSDPLQLTKVRAHTFQYPLYMELGNKDKKIMNYFQVRLLDKDFVPLVISGAKGSMTVLLIIDN
jgi:hypothetical protein